MKRSENRILTTHVGSMVRSPEIKALAGAKEGRAAIVARATAEVVKMQAAVGLDVVSDGEYGKSGWSNYALERLDGVRDAAGSVASGALAGARSGAVPGGDGAGNAACGPGAADGCLRGGD